MCMVSKKCTKCKQDLALDCYAQRSDGTDSMLAAQNNACAICGKTPNDNGRQLSVDHCHETMEVRGLLCVKCNAGIGMFCDNPMLLEQAIKYLRSHLDRSTVSRQAIEV